LANQFKWCRAVLGIAGSLFVTSCGQIDAILDTSALTPLFKARHTTDNTVRVLRDIYCQPYSGASELILADRSLTCIRGRLLYNRAASSVNAVLTQLIFAIEANANLVNNKAFQQELKQSVQDALAFQKFVEETAVKPSGQVQSFRPINPDEILEFLFENVLAFLAAARKADTKRRAVIACELKSLVLKPFEEVDQSTYPDPECAVLMNHDILRPNLR
jgi:hypothetical protein